MILLSQSASPAQSPDSSSTALQPYVWRNATIGGGGFVTGIIFHPRQKGLFYVRMDVGGSVSLGAIRENIGFRSPTGLPARI